MLNMGVLLTGTRAYREKVSTAEEEEKEGGRWVSPPFTFAPLEI